MYRFQDGDINTSNIGGNLDFVNRWANKYRKTVTYDNSKGVDLYNLAGIVELSGGSGGEHGQ